MSFDENKVPAFEHPIADLADQPNMLPNELKAYFDANPEILREGLNALCDALGDTTAAANLGFSPTAGIPVETLQAALEYLHQLLADAVVGKIPSGSVTQDKLAQDVRDRFSAIESATASESSTRAGADNNLQSQINTHTGQITSLISAKAEFVMGTYSGDDATERIISLGFTPSAVVVFDRNGTMSYSGLLSGGFATNAFAPPKGAVSICTGGFKVYYDYYADKITNGTSTNYSPYGYIAFK